MLEGARQLGDDLLHARDQAVAFIVALFFQGGAGLLAEADGAVVEHELKLLRRGREDLGAEIVVGGLLHGFLEGEALSEPLLPAPRLARQAAPSISLSANHA